MKKLLIVLLALLLPFSAGAWTLPVPSGLTAGDHIKASDSSTLGNYSYASLGPCTTVTSWDNSTTIAVSGVSCYLAAPTDNITVTGISETGAVAGQVLVIVNTGSVNSIIINESAGVNNQAGNITLGPLDTILYLYSGASWFQIGQANN